MTTQNPKKLAALKSSLKSSFSNRAMATYTFLSGNLTLLTSSLLESGMSDFDLPKTFTAVVLMGAALCYKPSEKDPRWLYGAGTGVITAQGVIAATAEGAGQIVQQIGTVPPAIQGVLLIRSAFNSTNDNKHYVAKTPFGKPLELIDKYPVITGSLIEGPGVAAISVGAFMSGEYGLGAAAAQWTVANVFLGLSDPNINRPKPPL